MGPLGHGAKWSSDTPIAPPRPPGKYSTRGDRTREASQHRGCLEMPWAYEIVDRSQRPSRPSLCPGAQVVGGSWVILALIAPMPSYEEPAIARRGSARDAGWSGASFSFSILRSGGPSAERSAELSARRSVGPTVQRSGQPQQHCSLRSQKARRPPPTAHAQQRARRERAMHT